MPVPLTLKVFKGADLVATREYDRDIIKIGRLSSAHLCLDDEKVSRIHSVIEVGADGSLSIIDMGSVEGTWVNGKRVNKGILAFGDEIKVGGTTIRLEDTAAQAAANLQAAAASVDEPTQVVMRPTAPVAPPPPAQVAPPPPAQVASAAPVAVAPAPAPVRPPPPPEEEEAYAGEQESQEPPHRALRQKGTGPLGLELRFIWGEDQMVGEYFVHPGAKKPFTVGSGAKVSFVMGDSRLGGPSFELVRAEKDGFSVRFTGKMKGEYWTKGEQIDLTQAIETRRATRDGDAYQVVVGADDFVVVELGGMLKVEACLQPIPKPVVVPFGETMDFTMLNILLVLFFVASVFVVSARNMLAEDEMYSDEMSSKQARIAKLIIKPPELEKKNPLLERLEKQKESGGEMAAKHRNDEGKAGKKDAPDKNARMAPKGDPSNKDQARMLTQKIFGGSSGGMSAIFGQSGLGGELKASMGNLFGATAGDAGGMGGLGLRGSGAGGGGVGDTIGIGGIGTKGRGGGMGAYGDGVGLGMGGKKGVDIGITSSEPMVMGSLDKELIRQVIHRNRGQIRFCYESQLTRYPKLNGKVTVKFVIAANGSVAKSDVTQSTAGNAELETCVAGRVRTWQFPKPKGGGVVLVTYPFIFKQSGQ